MENRFSIAVAGAEPIRSSEKPIDAVLHIIGRPPHHDNLDAQAAWFHYQAKQIMGILDLLPGGTRAALLVEMLKHQLSLLVVRDRRPAQGEPDRQQAIADFLVAYDAWALSPDGISGDRFDVMVEARADVPDEWPLKIASESEDE